MLSWYEWSETGVEKVEVRKKQDEIDQSTSGQSLKLPEIDHTASQDSSIAPRTLPRSILTGIKLSIYGGLAEYVPAAKATFSFGRCCTSAVRAGNFSQYYSESYPWEVCNFQKDISYSDNITYHSVNVTMAWAKKHCSGFQKSGFNQWLAPLCTYVSPYIGLLLICPVGEVSKSQVEWPGLYSWMHTVLDMIRNPMQEFVNILGDPASATFGAFYEIWSDVRIIYMLSSAQEDELLPWRREIHRIVALIGDINFTEHTGWRLRDRFSDIHPTSKRQDKTKSERGDGDLIEEAEPPTVAATLVPSSTMPSEAEVDRAMNIAFRARPGFGGAVLIPVLLMLVVTAATFFDTYNSKGDKDKALALAYCVWFSWILVVSVAGNCFATCISKVSLQAFEEVLRFDKDGEEPGSVALRDRFINGRKWDAWATIAADNTFDLEPVLNGMRSQPIVWLWFLCGQFLGYLPIAIASACATVIAWTTPTIGLGCRSFNFILYASLSMLVALIQVLRSWFFVRLEHAELHEQSLIVDSSKSKLPSSSRHKSSLKAVKVSSSIITCIYWSLVIVNFLTLVLGTLFHLIGIFRRCGCEHLPYSASTLIELNSKTAQALENAVKYWISTSYIAFGVQWLLCLAAIAGRRYIVLKMEQWPELAERGNKKRPAIANKQA